MKKNLYSKKKLNVMSFTVYENNIIANNSNIYITFIRFVKIMSNK